MSVLQARVSRRTGVQDLDADLILLRPSQRRRRAIRRTFGGATSTSSICSGLPASHATAAWSRVSTVCAKRRIEPDDSVEDEYSS